MSEHELHELLGCDVVPLFKVLFAQMAAACASIAAALHDACMGRRVCCWTHQRFTECEQVLH
jgi:hypothetical protein